MHRRLVLGLALSAALVLAACGPGGKADGAKGDPAMPPADPARAAAVNGYDKDGEPIDAVAAAEMPESALPPLKGDGAGQPPGAPPPPEKPAP